MKTLDTYTYIHNLYIYKTISLALMSRKSALERSSKLKSWKIIGSAYLSKRFGLTDACTNTIYKPHNPTFTRRKLIIIIIIITQKDSICNQLIHCKLHENAKQLS